jgi:sec-independent protein translocase protein TatA
MPIIGHLPELFVVLLIALLVFGPRRMIEMGSALGKAIRELRESTRDIPGLDRMTSLGGWLQDAEPRRTPLSSMSSIPQGAQPASVEAGDSDNPTPHPAAPTTGMPLVVDASVERAEEHPQE